jgi:hypothetical protein
MMAFLKKKLIQTRDIKDAETSREIRPPAGPKITQADLDKDLKIPTWKGPQILRKIYPNMGKVKIQKDDLAFIKEHSLFEELAYFRARIQERLNQEAAERPAYLVCTRCGNKTKAVAAWIGTDCLSCYRPFQAVEDNKPKAVYREMDAEEVKIFLLNKKRDAERRAELDKKIAEAQKIVGLAKGVPPR